MSEELPKELPKELPEASNSQASNYILYFVEGMDCQKNPRDTHNDLAGFAGIYTNNIEDRIKVRCHTLNVGKGLIAIFKTHLRGHSPPIDRDSYSNQILKEIIEDLNKNAETKIIVFGHSYGGYVTSRIAERVNLMNDNPNDIWNRIWFLTFGSIYIPPHIQTKKLHIQHYMPRGDSALRVNGLTTPDLSKFNKSLIGIRYPTSSDLGSLNGSPIFCNICDDNTYANIRWLNTYKTTIDMNDNQRIHISSIPLLTNAEYSRLKRNIGIPVTKERIIHTGLYLRFLYRTMAFDMKYNTTLFNEGNQDFLLPANIVKDTVPPTHQNSNHKSFYSSTLRRLTFKNQSKGGHNTRKHNPNRKNRKYESKRKNRTNLKRKMSRKYRKH
jgi:hypothetical protein